MPISRRRCRRARGPSSFPPSAIRITLRRSPPQPAQGVKIVVIDSDVDSPDVSVRIGTDNVEAGRMAAAAALDTEEQALVVGIVNYDAGTRNGQEREAGFRESLQEDPRVEKIYTITVLSTQEDAQAKTEQLLPGASGDQRACWLQ